MIEKLDTLEIYRMATSFAKAWNRKLVKCEKGESAVYDTLIKEGYEITRFPMKEEKQISIQRKKEKLKESRFPDALARYHGDAEPPFESCFFLDVKYKTKSEHLGVVNTHDYDGYVAFLRNFTVLVPFKIFFYLDDIKAIWVHSLRNPHDAPSLKLTIENMRGKEVYRIFRSELELWRRVVYTE